MKKVIFRCDAGTFPEIGTGHVLRCIKIAKELLIKKILKIEDIIFIIRGENDYNLGEKILSKTKFCYETYKNRELEANSRSELNCIVNHYPSLVIVDRLATSKRLIQGIKSRGIKVISFDDYGSGRIMTDLSICAIFDDVKKSENLLSGYKYLTLSEGKKKTYTRKSVKKIVATFGGHDARNLSNFFLSNVYEISQSIEIDLILGQVSQSQLIEFESILKKTNRERAVNFFINPINFREIITSADLGICSGGLTIFDLALSRIPTISIPQYRHQLATIAKLEKLGVTIMGTQSMKLENKYFKKQLNNLINDYNLRIQIRNASKKHIDGQGLNRVIKNIHKLLNDNKFKK